MNILRLAWSSYQDTASLKDEKRHLESLGFRYRRVDPRGPIPDKLAAYDVLIINSQFEVSLSFLQQFKNGLIVTASNGYDNLDLEACERVGVSVARTPLARSDAVVDHTFTLIDALRRDLHRTGFKLRTGEWDRENSYQNIRSNEDVSLGVLGHGVIGKRIVERALEREFDEILVRDPLNPPEGDLKSDVEPVDFGELLRESDVLTVHADLNESTSSLLGKEELRMLGPDSYLINTARGAIVDLDELLEILDRGELSGAGVDVFPEEPPSDVLDVNGLITTPHSAGFHPDLLKELREEVGSVIESYRDGDSLENRVTPRSEEEMRRLEPEPGV